MDDRLIGPPPLEFLVVAIGFTFVMALFGYAVRVVTGAAADFSWSVASGISDGVRRWAATAVRERHRSVSPVAPIDLVRTGATRVHARPLTKGR